MMRHHKSHLIRKLTGDMPQTRMSPERGHTLCASLRSRNALSTFHKRHHKNHHTKIYRKKAAAQIEPIPRTVTLCKPAQSKCMSTCHKSRFKRKFTGKMPRLSWSTLIKHRPLHLPQENLSVDTLFGEKGISPLGFRGPLGRHWTRKHADHHQKDASK